MNEEEMTFKTLSPTCIPWNKAECRYVEREQENTDEFPIDDIPKAKGNNNEAIKLLDISRAAYYDYFAA
jgi:hypothetical protein